MSRRRSHGRLLDQRWIDSGEYDTNREFEILNGPPGTGAPIVGAPATWLLDAVLQLRIRSPRAKLSCATTPNARTQRHCRYRCP